MNKLNLIAIVMLSGVPMAFGAENKGFDPLKNAVCDPKKIVGNFETSSIECLDAKGQNVQNTTPPNKVYVLIDQSILRAAFFRDGIKTNGGSLNVTAIRGGTCLVGADARDTLDSLNGLPNNYGKIGIDKKSGELIWNMSPSETKICRGNRDMVAYQILHLRARIDTRFKEPQVAETVTFLNIESFPDGSPKYINEEHKARQFCASQGAHVPSARELAQLSVNLGAKGIVVSCGSEDLKCSKVEVLNEDLSSDSFYFSFSGYQRPPGQPGNNLFISSSVSPSRPDLQFYLRGDNGKIEYNSGYSLVRCASGL
jgi:hypothetical protein